MDNSGDCLRVKEDAVEHKKEDGTFQPYPIGLILLSDVKSLRGLTKFG